MDDIIDVLFKGGNLTEINVTMLRAYMDRWKVGGYHALIETHVIPDFEIADFLAEYLKIPRYYNLGPNDISEAALEKISYIQAREHCCLPVEITKDKLLKVIFADPTNKKVISKLVETIGIEITPAVSSKHEIEVAVGNIYSPEQQLGWVFQEGS